MVFGPVAISYNINAVDTLVLDAPTLAKIFNGTITNWNDPAVTALNQSMPAGPITVVHRSDESATTETFQDYLEAASDGAWGKGTAAASRARRQGGEGNEGTAATVKNTGGRDHLQRVVVRQREPVHRQDPGRRTRWHQPRLGRQDHRRRASRGRRQQPGARYVVVLQADQDGDAHRARDLRWPAQVSRRGVAKAVRALRSTVGAGQSGLEDEGYMPLPADQSRC